MFILKTFSFNKAVYIILNSVQGIQQVRFKGYDSTIVYPYIQTKCRFHYEWYETPIFWMPINLILGVQKLDFGSHHII